jgi:hypothetical protein
MMTTPRPQNIDPSPRRPSKGEYGDDHTASKADNSNHLKPLKKHVAALVLLATTAGQE